MTSSGRSGLEAVVSAGYQLAAWAGGILAEAENPAGERIAIGSADMALLLVSLAICGWLVWKIRHNHPPLAYEGRRPVPWNGRDVTVAFVALYGSMIVFQGLLLNAYGVHLDAEPGLPDAVKPALLVAQSVAEVLVMVLTIALLARHRGAGPADFGLTRGHTRHDVAAGVIGFLFVLAPVSILYVMLKPEELHPLVELVQRRPAQLWLIGFCAVVVAPLVEEFFFRVLLQGWLERWERDRQHAAHVQPALPTGLVPILISAFFFAAMHAEQWPAPVPLFFLALVMGYLYHQTHRLLPSLVVHVCLNGATFLNLWLAAGGPERK